MLTARRRRRRHARPGRDQAGRHLLRVRHRRSIGTGHHPDQDVTGSADVEKRRLRDDRAARVGGDGDPAGPQRVGAGHLVLSREVSPLLLGLLVRQPQLGDRPGDNADARRLEPRLQVERRRHGPAVVRGERRLERHRSEPGDRRRQERVAVVGQLLERDQDAPHRSGDRQALQHRDDAARAQQPPARTADQWVGGGPVHHQAGRLLVSVRLVRSLLPRRRQHLQRRRRPLARRSRARMSTRAAWR